MSTFAETIERLFNRRVRFSSVIDVGCADGQFFLTLFSKGLFPDAVPLNVDANRIYEDSLKAIKNAVGGHYRIGAVTDFEGEIEITESIHPYWSSIRPAGDLYWDRVNNLTTARTRVAATTLDVLARELALKPPFLLKMDVQGAEKNVLQGAREVLKNTLLVISEADIADFQALNETLLKADFTLYDLTNFNRIKDGTLGWFYASYISTSLNHLCPREFWDEKENAAVIQAQVDRRKAILELNTKTLNRLKFKDHKVNRNELCPCGSGQKFKHCCGSLNL